MKNIFSKLTVAFLLLAFSCAHGEVYSWVDKDGKKHFGEKVPKEYASQSKTLEVKPINTMDAAKITKPPEDNNVQRQNNRFVPPLPDSNSDTQNLSSCEQQKMAYQRSVECYSRCQMNNNDINSNHVNNVAACRNCTDVKKPNCN